MNLIKREPLFEENELYQFVVNTFKDGMVPKDDATFKACFNNETTDGSLCFSYKFGKDKDDWAMLFFYETNCAVPVPYKKHLRAEEYCNMCLLILEYQLMLAKKIDNVEYLEATLEDASTRYEINVPILLSAINRFDKEDEVEDEEKAINERLRSMENYKNKYEEFSKFITEKIEKLQNKLGV